MTAYEMRISDWSSDVCSSDLWTFHFIPTSCSWLNAVEGFFAKLTRRRLKNGVFHSVVDLQAAINRFIKEHNEDPRPFIWKADPDEIIAAVRRGHRSEERRVGKSVSVRVDLGGRRIIKKKKSANTAKTMHIRTTKINTQ